MEIRFDNQVAIVTGSGAGIGKSYVMELARRGAKVVVNDFSGRVGADLEGSNAFLVAQEIKALGGEAIAYDADVSDASQVNAMVEAAYAKWGRIDILINNAGILRDASFTKTSHADFQKVLDVHLMGAVNCSQAVWPYMKASNFGRILMTTSSSGLYGNFGQANYGAAKMALIGLMNVLQIEGEKNHIHINAIAPGAATQMTENLIAPEVLALMNPDAVTPAALYLVSEQAPKRTILCATAGGYSQTIIHETEGIYLSEEERTPEKIAAHMADISDEKGQMVYSDGGGQIYKFIKKAAAAKGINL